MYRWDWKGVLYYELLPRNQMIYSNKYCFQLDQLKAELIKKHLESVNRKHIILHHVSLMTRQTQLDWEVLIHHTVIYQTLHFQISIHCGLYKILLLEKNFNSLEDCKRHQEQFFVQKESFGKMEL